MIKVAPLRVELSSILGEMRISEKHEKSFQEKRREFYRDLYRSLSALLEGLIRATNGFTKIDASVLVEDPRRILLLRYAVRPPISREKLATAFGISSSKLGAWETGKSKEMDLKIATQLAEFFDEAVDPDLIPIPEAIAELAASELSNTKYRIWRMAIQESKIRSVLERSGYTEDTEFKGDIRSVADLQPGKFVHERKIDLTDVEGVPRGKEKANYVIRLFDGRILTIEAKAVGVRVDSEKRKKEFIRKAEAWRAKFGKRVVTVAVIAGFFGRSVLEDLAQVHNCVIWEHRLNQDLPKILRTKPSSR